MTAIFIQTFLLDGRLAPPPPPPSRGERGEKRALPPLPEDTRASVPTYDGDLPEHGARAQADRERQFRCRQFLGVFALGLEHFDLPALAGDPQAVGTDLDDLADLALDGTEGPGQVFPGIEDLHLLAVERG